MNSSDIISLVILLLPVVLSLAGALYQRLVQALPESRRQRLAALAQVAVRSAEQEFSGSGGDLKKRQALALASSLAKKFGVSVPPSTLAGVIEAAVHELNQEQAFLPSPQPVEAAQPVPAVESGN